MTFTWKIPPWLRNEDSTHMAVLLTDAGGEQVSLAAEGVRETTPPKHSPIS
jgi:hypothetical protein